MPIAFVRKYPFSRATGGNTTVSNTGLTLTTGDLAVITVIWYNITVGVFLTDTITITDSNGNVWQKVPGTFQQQAIGGGTGFDSIGIQLWYSKITNGGTGVSITAHFPAQVNYPGLYGAECTIANTVDQVSAAKSSSAVVSSGTITTGAADTFIYGSLYDDNQTGTAMGGSWTLLDDMFNNYYHGYAVPGVVTTIEANTNSGSAINRFVAVVASFGAATNVDKNHNLDAYIQALTGRSHNIDAYIIIPFTDGSHSIDVYIQGAAVAREFVLEASNLIPPITNPNAFVKSRVTLATPARDFIQSAVTLKIAAMDFVDAAVSLAQRSSGYVKAAVTLLRGASPSHNIDVVIATQPLSFVKSAVSLTQKLMPTGCQGSFPDISFVKAEVWLVQPGDHSRQAPGTALTTVDDWLSQVDANNAYSVVARFVLAGIPLIVTGFSSGVISWQTRTRQWLRLVDFEPGGVVLSTRTSTRRLPNGQIITTTTKTTLVQDTTITEVTTVNSATPNRVSRSVTELSKGGHRVTRSIETDTINGIRTTTEKKIVDAQAAPSKDNIQPIKVTTLDGVQHYQFFATANSPAWAGGDAEGTTSTVTAVSISGQTRTTDQTISSPDGKIISIHTDETGLRNTGTTTTDTQENFQGIQTTTVKTVSFPDGSQEVTTTTTNNITGDSTETTVETATDENGLTTTTTTAIETVTFQDPITSNLRTTVTKTVTIQGPTGTTVDTTTDVRNNFEDDLLANKIKVYLIQEFTLNCVIDRFSKEALEEIAIDHQKNFAIAELIGQQLGNMDLSWTLRQNLISQLNQAINCIDPVQLQALGKTYGVVFAPSASSFRAKYIPGTLPAVFELQMIVQARSDLVTGLKGL